MVRRCVVGLLLTALPLLLTNCERQSNVQRVLSGGVVDEFDEPDSSDTGVRKSVKPAAIPAAAPVIVRNETRNETSTGPPVLAAYLTSTAPPTTAPAPPAPVTKFTTTFLAEENEEEEEDKDKSSTASPDEDETSTTSPEEEPIEETTTSAAEDTTTSAAEDNTQKVTARKATTQATTTQGATTTLLATTTAPLRTTTPAPTTTGPTTAEVTKSTGPPILNPKATTALPIATTSLPRITESTTMGYIYPILPVNTTTAAYIYPIDNASITTPPGFLAAEKTTSFDDWDFNETKTTPDPDLDASAEDVNVTTTIDADLTTSTPEDEEEDPDFAALTTEAAAKVNKTANKNFSAIVPIPLVDDDPSVARNVSNVSRKEPPLAEARKKMAEEIEKGIVTSTAPNTTTPEELEEETTTTSEPEPETTTSAAGKATTVDKGAIRAALDRWGVDVRPKLPEFEASAPKIICDGSTGCFRGECVNGKCQCDTHWVGDRCNVRACAEDCPKGTRCQDGKCQKCEQDDCGGCQTSCGPHGRCVNETCYCEYGFAGPQCTRPVCPTNPQCSGHGACLLGVCLCDKGYNGIACHHKDSSAAQLANLGKLKGTKLHALLPHSESLKLSTIRTVYRSQLADLQFELRTTYRTINECLGNGTDATACSRIQKLRAQALSLNLRHKALQKKIAVVEEDATNGAAARPFGHGENMRIIRELAFAIFANQRRVSVRTGMYGQSKDAHYTAPNTTAIDAKLAEMWKSLSAEEVVLFVDLAKDAIAAEQRAWAVAHELFVDEQLTLIHAISPALAAFKTQPQLRGTPTKQQKTSKEVLARIDKRWAALSSKKRLEYYVNSSHLAFQMNDKTKLTPRWSMLTSAANNLAFDLFAQQKWLPAFTRLSKSKKGVKHVAMLSAVDQNVLAQYRRLKPKAKQVWMDKAKELLYPKLFYWSKWQNFSSHILPKFQVVGFQIGLRDVVVRRAKHIDKTNNLQSLADTVTEVVAQITRGGKFQLMPFDAVHTSHTRKIFSFVLVLASDINSLSTRVVTGLTKSLHSGEFRAVLVTHGLQITPYFPVGGEPHVVFGTSVRPRCPHDYKCARGTCTNGICACLPGYTGHDCSEKISCDCSPENGLCDRITGRCECYGSWTGKRCDMLACPNDCTGNGMCSNGTCICNALYKGEDCSERTCQSDCSGHGRCCFRFKCTEKVNQDHTAVDALEHLIGISPNERSEFERLTEDDKTRVIKNPDGFTVAPTCICQDGYGGGSCGCLSETPGQECSGHGICYENQCWCRAGFAGASCGRRTCIPNDCSGHGQCVAGACMCSPGWATSSAGGGCDKRVCQDESCSGHGVCVKGDCDCAHGWDGANCETPVCPGDPPCSGHGECERSGNLLATVNKCVCTGEWYGDACEEQRCFRDPVSNEECNGDKGVCEDNTCKCRTGWVGPTCSTELCPENCHFPSWGRCIESRYCLCAPGRKGIDCSVAGSATVESTDWKIPFLKVGQFFNTSLNLRIPKVNLPKIKGPEFKLGNKVGGAERKGHAEGASKDSDEEESPGAKSQDGGAPNSLRHCAKCCSQSCEETCHLKSSVGHDISAVVYSFPDCFFGCQRSCVKDCPKNPKLPCGRKITACTACEQAANKE